MVGPYVKPLYNSDGAARMSSLALRKGDIQAEGSQRQGQIWGGAVQNLGEIAAKTMGDIAKYKADAPRRDLEKAQVASATTDLKRKAELESVFQEVGQMRPDEAVNVLRSRGFSREADALAEHASKLRETAIDTELKGYKVAGERIDQAANLLHGVTLLGTPEAQAAQYAKVAPQLRAMVGEQLAGVIPDQYDPTTPAKLVDLAKTERERMDTRAAVLRDTRDAAADTRASHTFAVTQASRWASTVNSQAEWDKMTQGLTALGAPKETIEALGPTYSPEAVAKAVALGTTPARAATTPQVGSEADTISTWAREHGKTVETMTSAEKNAALGARASALRKPDDPKAATDDERFKPPTRSEYNSAVRDKANRLDDAEHVYATSNKNADDLKLLEATKERILADFAEQTRPAAAATSPLPPKAPASMGDLGRGAAPVASHAPAAPPAPARPAAPANASTPPPEVEQQLRQGGPGQYEFSDGSVWRVAANGTITRLK